MHFCREGCLMVKQTDSFYPLFKLRKWSGIAAIGIASWLIWNVGSLFIKNDCTIFPMNILPSLLGSDFCQAKSIFSYGILMNIMRGHLFPDDEAIGIHSMIQREGQKFRSTVLIQKFRL